MTASLYDRLRLKDYFLYYHREDEEEAEERDGVAGGEGVPLAQRYTFYGGELYIGIVLSEPCHGTRCLGYVLEYLSYTTGNPVADEEKTAPTYFIKKHNKYRNDIDAPFSDLCINGKEHVCGCGVVVAEQQVQRALVVEAHQSGYNG